MANPQLLQYIENERKRGVTDDQLKTALHASQWPPAEIEAAFASGPATPPPPPTPSLVPPQPGAPMVQPVPHEIQGWNWGAAGLTWIWGIKFNVWLSLLMFFPPLSWFWWVVLGVKGNEWAWGARHWSSVDEFHAAQQPWKKWGLIVFVLGIVTSIALVIGYLFLFVSLFTHTIATPTTTNVAVTPLNALTSNQAKARDAQRKYDLATIRTTLQLYADDHQNSYPSVDGTITSGTSAGQANGGLTALVGSSSLNTNVNADANSNINVETAVNTSPALNVNSLVTGNENTNTAAVNTNPVEPTSSTVYLANIPNPPANGTSDQQTYYYTQTQSGAHYVLFTKLESVDQWYYVNDLFASGETPIRPTCSTTCP